MPPRTPARRPGSRRRTRPAKPGTSPGQGRSATPARGSPACEPWCDCGRRAGMAGLLPPEGHDGQNGTRVAGQARHRLVSASARPGAARPASRGAGSRDAAGVAAVPHGVS